MVVHGQSERPWPPSCRRAMQTRSQRPLGPGRLRTARLRTARLRTARLRNPAASTTRTAKRTSGTLRVCERTESPSARVTLGADGQSQRAGNAADGQSFRGYDPALGLGVCRRFHQPDAITDCSTTACCRGSVLSRSGSITADAQSRCISTTRAGWRGKAAVARPTAAGP
jgi:hypothetical protein